MTDLRGKRFFPQLSTVQIVNALAQMIRQTPAVCDVKIGHLPLPLQSLQHTQDLCLADGIQHGGRLVQHDQFGIQQHYPGYHCPLQFTAGELDGMPLQVFPVQSEIRQIVQQFPPGHPQVIMPADLLKALLQPGVRVERDLGVLKKDLDLLPLIAAQGVVEFFIPIPDRSTVGTDQTGNDLPDGALAAAAGT